MNKRVTVAALVFGVAAAPVVAKASLNLTPLMLLPDICAFHVCIQFTHSAALMQVQQLLATAENLKRLSGSEMLGELQGQARAIWLRSHTGSPLRIGSSAAAQADAQTQAVDAHISAAGSAARSATGSLAAAQAQALYLDTIAIEATKANELHAAQMEQQQNQDDALSAAIRAEAGDGTSIGVK